MWNLVKESDWTVLLSWTHTGRRASFSEPMHILIRRYQFLMLQFDHGSAVPFTFFGGCEPKQLVLCWELKSKKVGWSYRRRNRFMNMQIYCPAAVTVWLIHFSCLKLTFVGWPTLSHFHFIFHRGVEEELGEFPFVKIVKVWPTWMTF